MPVYDVGLDANGDLPAVTSHITGATLVIQRIETRLNFFLGEYILDVTKGLPYLTLANQSPPDPQAFGALVRATIEGTPGVARIRDFETAVSASQSGAGNVWQYTGTIVAEAESDAEEELIALGIGIDLTGNTTPAVVTYHRLGQIAP